ncbi:MAG: bacteriohemerythrin [Thiohalomonadaceae bacterium]
MPVMIAWSDAFSVDIQEIDEQHKCLVDLINKLYEVLAGHGDEAIGGILDELVRYTRVHFSVEECLMRLFAYEGYEEHKKIHDALVKRVLELQAQYRAGEQKVGMELLYFLKDWLMDHIQRVDKHYSRHLVAHGVKQKWLRKFW